MTSCGAIKTLIRLLVMFGGIGRLKNLQKRVFVVNHYYVICRKNSMFMLFNIVI